MKSDNMLASGSKHQREPEDFYATDPKALEIVLPILNKIGLNKKIWECACGAGHLSKVLENSGYIVKSTDVIYRGYGKGGIDFLEQKDKYDGDILTNPPYKLAEEFVRKAIELLEDGNRAVSFLKVQFLESARRLKLFREFPPRYIIVNSERQHTARNAEFEKYTTATLCFCWFVFEKGYSGNPEILWI